MTNRMSALVSGLCALVIPYPAQGARIDVVPGPLAITNAIASARAGDVLMVHAGTYNESVDVNKKVKILGEPNAVSLIDATCSATVALRISAAGVVIKNLQVANGTVGGIEIQNVDNIKVKRVYAWVSPGSIGCGTEQYGIKIDQSTRVKLSQVLALGDPFTTGFQNAGIYVRGIATRAKVKLHDVVSDGNARGILVEDVMPDAVLLKLGEVSDNDTGVLLSNADGVTVGRLNLMNNTSAGIELDATSDQNLITRNDISGSTVDVIDNGTGNCWKKNTFTTGSVSPCP